MKQPSSANKKLSRYTQGGETFRSDVRIKWWERRKFTKLNSDIDFEITPKYEGRPDLIAFDVYNDVALNWLVLQYNTILDIKEELVAGKIIKLPHPNRIHLDILNQSIGGTLDK